MTKTQISQQATKYGVKATYSGSKQTLFIKGDDTQVKSFIRVINLKGKGDRKFSLAQQH
jgi:hypothetical protein